jgi:formate dehydrogenase subunit beta
MTESVKLTVGESPGAALKPFLKALLEKKVVRAVMCARPTASGSLTYALAADPEEIEKSSPMAPYMPVNAATVVSDMTRVEPFNEPVAVVLRPCESRALLELVKLKQASLENLLIIALDCHGTVSFADYKNKDTNSAPMRAACGVCEYPVAPVSDIEVGLFGCRGNEMFLIGRTDAGKEALEKAGVGEEGAPANRDTAIEELKKKRSEALEKLVQETRQKVGGWDNLLAHFADCINCHNCMTLCPVCYCRQCFFDSEILEVEGRRHLGAAARRGAVRMPDDTLLFHLTRMNHMGLSCVGCGLCSDACPNDVDVFSAFRTVAHNAQKEFDYVPGCSLEDELPLAVYREEEFQTIGE